MRAIYKNSLLVSIIPLFIGCSNIQVGFEEDSIFYQDSKSITDKPIAKKKSVKINSLKAVEDKEAETIFYYEQDDGE